MLKNMVVASAIAAGAFIPAAGAVPLTLNNNLDQCYQTGTSCGPGVLQSTLTPVGLGGPGRGADNLLVGLLGSPQTGTGLLGAVVNGGR
jgi:hypothetical protein